MRWRILLLLFLARVGLGLQFQTLGSVGDDLVAVFGLDYVAIGAMIGFFMAPGLFLTLPAGYAARFLSDRVLTGVGLAALALGGALSGMATDSWMIGAGRLLAGAGFVFANLYLTKMTADWFVGKEIATAMSILVMSWPLGIAIGQVGHEWLAAAVDWRWPFFVASSYCALFAAGLLTLYRQPSEQASATASTPSKLSMGELRLILLAGAAWAVFNAGYVVYLTFGPLALETQGADPFEAAAIISIGSWVMIFSGALCGYITDRTGRPDAVLVICILGAIIAMGLLAVDGAGLPASLLFGLIGMAPAGVIMALSGEAMRPENRAFGMGVFFSVYYAVMAAAPPIAGWIYDQTGEPFYPLQIGVLLFALVIPATLAFRALQRRAERVEAADA
ncbi:MAG: MFS transporter [Pseudomonadota bacterium]